MFGNAFKKDKIRKQAIALTLLIAIWIISTLLVMRTDLSSLRAMNNYQRQVVHFAMTINDYYQSTINRAISQSTVSEADELLKDDQEKILMEARTLALSLQENTESLSFTNANAEKVMRIRANNIMVATEDLSGSYETAKASDYLVHQGAYLQRINSDVDVLNELTLKEQDQLRSSLQTRLSINSAVLIGLIVLSNVWLLIFKTLKPIKEMKRLLWINGEDYQRNAIGIERDDEIGDLVKSYNHLQNRSLTIEGLVKKLSEHDHFEEILDFIFESFKPFIPFNRIGIAVLSADGKFIRALSARSDRPVKLGKNYTALLEKTSLESIINSGEPRIINDLENYYSLRRHSESTGLILEEGMVSSVTLPLIVREECVGVVFFSSDQKNVYNNDHIRFLNTIAGSLASAFDHSFLNDQLLISTIRGFAQLVESKDSETGNHIDRMQTYSVMISEFLYTEGFFQEELNENLIKQIRDFSPLHDIGKVAIPDQILLKPGKLLPEEFSVMKEHAVIGSDILKNMNDQISGQHRDFYKTGIEIVRHHHEKYDGTGYPDKLIGEEIPLSARIVALADVIDALTSKRPYKEAFSIEKAKSIIEEGRARHFDPYIVDIVLKHWDHFVNQIEVFQRESAEEKLYKIS